MKIAAERPKPIPVFTEMSSINPVILLPAALAARAERIAEGFIASLTLGAGQFCTNPGVVLGLAGSDLDRFTGAVARALAGVAPATMLTPGIAAAYTEGLGRFSFHAGVATLARGAESDRTNGCRGALFATEAATFLADDTLQQEVFGASSIVVRCKDLDQLRAVIEHLEGQLTATLHLDPDDSATAAALLPLLERKAGRILANGFPTGVEVGHAMMHGGPFPATSDPRFTSVGSLAIRRFLRPVCYQNMPSNLLPPALQDGNPLGIPRRIDGIWHAA